MSILITPSFNYVSIFQFYPHNPHLNIIFIEYFQDVCDITWKFSLQKCFVSLWQSKCESLFKWMSIFSSLFKTCALRFPIEPNFKPHISHASLTTKYGYKFWFLGYILQGLGPKNPNFWKLFKALTQKNSKLGSKVPDWSKIQVRIPPTLNCTLPISKMW